MTEAPDTVARLLEMSDEGYFSVTETQLLDLQDALADAMEGQGTPPPPWMALGAPARVDLDGQSTIPVLLGRFHTGQRAWEVNPDPNLHILVKKHATGELLWARPLVNMRRGEEPLLSGVGEPPDQVNATSTRAGVKKLDLRERIADVGPGTISVTALTWEIRSNTVDIELHRDVAAPETTAKTSPFVRHQLDQRPLLDPEIDVPTSGSARSGIKIRVALQTTRDRSIVRTEFNQPVLAGHVVLVRLDERPVVIPTFVPVQPVDRGDGTPAYNALYIVDLGAEGHPVSAGTYQVYLDIDAELEGPFPLTVTD